MFIIIVQPASFTCKPDPSGTVFGNGTDNIRIQMTANSRRRAVKMESIIRYIIILDSLIKSPQP